MQQSKQIICKLITNSIKDLHDYDCGAINIWKDSDDTEFDTELVDIEWSDGVSAFVLSKVLKLIKEKEKITKSELIDYCLPR